MNQNDGWQHELQRPEDEFGMVQLFRSHGRRISDLETRTMPGSVSLGSDRKTSSGFALTAASTVYASAAVSAPAGFSLALVTVSAQVQLVWDAKASTSGGIGWGEAYGQLQIGSSSFLPIGAVPSRQEADRDGALSRVIKSIPLGPVLVQLRGEDLGPDAAIEARAQLWCSSASNTPAGYHADPDMTCDLMMQVQFIR